MKRLVMVIFVLSFIACGVSVAWSEGVVKIGTTMGLSGYYSGVANNFLKGYTLAFEEINSQGGVKGRRLEQIVYDDGYDPARTIKGLNKLVYEDKVPLLFAVFGTPPNAVASLRLKVFKIPLFFPCSGGGFLYSNQPYVFTFQASYMSESRAMIEQAVKDGYKRIGVVYLTNTYGWDCKIASLKEARKQNVEAFPIPLKKSEDIPLVVKELLDKKADAVYLAVPNKFLVPLLRFMDAKGYHPGLYAECYCRLADALQAIGDDVASRFPTAVAGRFLPQLSENYRCVTWYKKALEMFSPEEPPNPVAFQGYLMARTLGEILKQAPSLDPKGIIKGAESVKGLDVGLPEKISYSPTDHVGLTRVFLYRVKHGELVPLVR